MQAVTLLGGDMLHPGGVAGARSLASGMPSGIIVTRASEG